jgi:xylan 1,4-beta-xylosidase
MNSRSALSALFLTFPLFAGASFGADGRVDVQVDAEAGRGPYQPIWTWFGFDEPNYAYMKNGRKLLKELASLAPGPVYIRSHNLLTSGDGTPSLKWGSTNACTEDASGRPVYDFTILDRIFDAYREAGVRPLVEIGFMPKALSVKPEPYRHEWPKGTLWTGWAYPPRDFDQWKNLVREWVRHAAMRYGAKEVAEWPWEAWNEPDIGYWKGTEDEYYHLYDVTAEAVKAELGAQARIGGPHSTGANHAYLRRFLEHCARGSNHATGKPGAPLDFIAFHPKGSTRFVDGHVRMGIREQLRAIDGGFKVVVSFPEFRDTPVVLGESDPEGAAALSARVAPQNGYRNGALYGAYLAESMARTWELARRHRANLIGSVTWAFEFEDQPYFEGFRSLATNGIDKPVLNVFRMLGLLGGEWVEARSSGALNVDDVLAESVRKSPDVNAIATRRPQDVSVLLWNYHDDDLPAPDAQIVLTIDRLPESVKQVGIRHYRMDETHSNAFTAWKKLGSPQKPSAEEYARLEAAGRLEMLGAPETRPIGGRAIKLEISLPRQAVSLVKVEWN